MKMAMIVTPKLSVDYYHFAPILGFGGMSPLEACGTVDFAADVVGGLV